MPSMPSMPSSANTHLPPVPSPSNPILRESQTQWLFTDSEMSRTPSLLDGMSMEAEHTSRSKGVNFITQVGILLKLPQLTLCTASVYLHRFFMRFSMVDLPQRQGMHPYPVAATALFLATKVEENCRKMRELVVACCRVAQKQPSLVVDEQSKEFWKWRDIILHNEDLLLEALCFDLQLEQPYKLLYDFLCFFHVQDNKRLRNAAWAFVNDSTFTVLCVQFTARTIAAAALYAAAKHCEVGFKDDSLGRPWWTQLDVDLEHMKRACNRITEIYEQFPLPRQGQHFPTTPLHGDEAITKTRIRNRGASEERSGFGNRPESLSGGGEINNHGKREREGREAMNTDEDGSAKIPQQKQQPQQQVDGPSEGGDMNGATDRSPKRQRRSEGEVEPQGSDPQDHTTTTRHNGTNHQSRIPNTTSSHQKPHPLPPVPAVVMSPAPGPDTDTDPATDIAAATAPAPTGPQREDELLQRRIDAIVKQGIPPVGDGGDQEQESSGQHAPRGDKYRPPTRDRDKDKDRDRDRQFDKRSSVASSSNTSLPQPVFGGSMAVRGAPCVDVEGGSNQAEGKGEDVPAPVPGGEKRRDSTIRTGGEDGNNQATAEAAAAAKDSEEKEEGEAAEDGDGDGGSEEGEL